MSLSPILFSLHISRLTLSLFISYHTSRMYAPSIPNQVPYVKAIAQDPDQLPSVRWIFLINRAPVWRRGEQGVNESGGWGVRYIEEWNGGSYSRRKGVAVIEWWRSVSDRMMSKEKRLSTGVTKWWIRWRQHRSYDITERDVKRDENREV